MASTQGSRDGTGRGALAALVWLLAGCGSTTGDSGPTYELSENQLALLHLEDGLYWPRADLVKEAIGLVGSSRVGDLTTETVVGDWIIDDWPFDGSVWTLDADGSYTLEQLGDSRPGSWALDGSLLTTTLAPVESPALRRVTGATSSALVDGQLHVEVFLRPTGTGDGWNGTWVRVSLSILEEAFATFRRETWEIDGTAFRYDVVDLTASSSQLSRPAMHHGTGTLEINGDRAAVAFDESDRYYSSDNVDGLYLERGSDDVLLFVMEHRDDDM